MAKSTQSATAEKTGTREPGNSQTARTSRAAQSRENAADPRLRPVIQNGRRLNLPYVKPRPGFVQRYGRMSYDQKEDDANNVAKLEGEGWVPRKAETLRSGEAAPIIKKGEYAGHIGNRGHILMERSIELNEAYREANREATDAQMNHVQNQLMSEHRPGVKGLGRPKMSVESAVGVRGRRSVQVQDDDEPGDSDVDDDQDES